MPAADESARLFAARLLKPARQTQLFETLVRCLATEPGHGARVQVQAAEPARDATVLVADDNAVNLKVACAMLAKLGYGILSATDGREAVEAVAQAASQGRRIAAVLMDVNMPDVDGLEATRQIHAAWGRNSPPIIALTAAASAEDRQRCHDAGMDDYLTKPLQVAELARALEKWIGDAAAASATPQEAASPPAAVDAAVDPVAAAAGSAVDAAPAPVYLDPARLEEFREFDDDARGRHPVPGRYAAPAGGDRVRSRGGRRGPARKGRPCRERRGRQHRRPGPAPRRRTAGRREQGGPAARCPCPGRPPACTVGVHGTVLARLEWPVADMR
jgi:CheY-like chemotaxis protein